MNKIIIAVLIIVAAGSIGYVSWTRKQTENDKAIDLTGHSNQPFMECVECIDGKTWQDYSCCTDDFEANCEAQNGVIRISDLHPLFTVLRGCFQKAPDAGNSCASGKDCLAGCDLKSAIESGKCKFIKKEFTGEKNRFGRGSEFYTATYSCNTAKPGICQEAIESVSNPGGEELLFEMKNKTLIETLRSGPVF